MNTNLSIEKEACLASELLTPKYGDRESLKPPPLKEVMEEWIDSINFIKNKQRFLAFFFALFHGITFFVFLIYVKTQISIESLMLFFAAVIFLATIYNTVWYHRYCSHQSFRFSNKIYPRVFLWLNPVGFREESYVIPHQIHHRFSDSSKDPYGPHLGWVGSYLATESQQKLDTNISEENFEKLCLLLSHIPVKLNSYKDFKQTGSVENTYFYFCRFLFAQMFWGQAFYAAGGVKSLICWYAALFFFTFLLRDFNWRGHGGNFRNYKKKGWEFHSKSRALNQRFYGLIAGEWHDNHHNFPLSANTGFLPGQLDIAFFIIQIMKKIGIVEVYVDASPKFFNSYHKRNKYGT